MQLMHDTAVLKYISFDERVFRNGPVLLDDGIYSHMMIADQDEYLPLIKDLSGGEYTLLVSAIESYGKVALEFSLYSAEHKSMKRKVVWLDGFRLKMPFFATSCEREDYRNSAYAMILEQNLDEWFAESDGYFFETLGIFTRTVLEDTFGDVFTQVFGDPETSVTHPAHQTTIH